MGDYPLIKVVIIGDSSVGKSSLLSKYTEGVFPHDTMSTIGFNFMAKNVQFNGRAVPLQVWDTAGQERFRIVPMTFYRGARGVILAYDSTSQDSFAGISGWVEEIHKSNENDIPKVLIATKTDLIEKKIVSTADGQRLADSLGMDFFETSALLDKNVTEVFEGLVKQILLRLPASQDPARITISRGAPKQHKCCKRSH